MQDDDNDSDVIARLSAPMDRARKRQSATSLVRRHYDAISEAATKARRGGKTWEEIGRALRPTDPIPAGTVGRAYARVTVERTGFEPKPHQSQANVVTAGKTVLIQGEDQTALTARPARPNPFSKTVDPIRNNIEKDNQNA